MRQTRLLLVLCTLAFALAVVLVRPLPSRADTTDSTATPDPGPTSTDAIVQQLPVVNIAPPAPAAPEPVRRPASVKRHAAFRIPHIPHIPIGTKIVSFAKHLIGVPYEWGGTSPRTGFDCSGFVRYVYAHFGVSLAHSSYAQFATGSRVGRSALRPGDLVFFNGIGHVGIYIGGGRFIHAPHSGTRVSVEPLQSDYDGARRILRHA